MISVKWSKAADADIAEILQYFMDKSEEAYGKRIVARIFEVSQRLKSSPFSGRPGYFGGTREIVIRTIPYLIVYTVMDKTTVRILRVMHTARRWPPDETEG